MGNPGKTILEMAVKVEALLKDKPFFLLSLAYVYEDASEALHGTLYGAEFHMGMHQPNNMLRMHKMAEKMKRNKSVVQDMLDYEFEVKYSGFCTLLITLTLAIKSTFLLLKNIGFKDIDYSYDESEKCLSAMMKNVQKGFKKKTHNINGPIKFSTEP